MERTCEQCGKAFEAQRPTAKFCGSSCRGKATLRRQRAAQQQLATVTTLDKLSKATLRPPAKRKPATKPRAAKAPEPEQQPEPPGLINVVTRQLTEASKLDTYQGQQALLVAGRLVRAKFDTGSAYAALSKELDRLMASALADVKPEPDLLDTLVGEVVEMRTRRRG